jgi:hypothetical protein
LIRLHPTILIGFGSYGRGLLRRVLLDAHDRGSLRWDSDSDADGSGGRRLQDLALLAVGGPGEDDTNEGGVARDLYLQIQEIPASHSEEFIEALAVAKDRLLNVARFAADSNRMRLGLDVIVLAQPANIAVLGNLEDLLHPAMDALSTVRGLQSPAAGADLLNFLMILDFNRYWDNNLANRAFQHELRACVGRWEERQQSGKPSFARIYLVDRETLGGDRDEADRVEEVVTLLGFLLFEGQRDDASLRCLYQRENDSVRPLATFGIRVIERNRGLVRRLAAAVFAFSWLEYLGGGDATDSSRAALRTRLQEYGPDCLDFSAEHQALREAVDKKLAEFEVDLADFAARSAGEDGWARAVRDRIEVSFLRLRAAMTAFAGQRGRQVAKERLEGVSERLEQIVSDCLGRPAENPAEPLSALAIIEQLNELRGQLELLDPPTPAPDASKEDPFQQLEEVHREYRQGLSQQVDGTRVSLCWLGLAALVAAAWSPLVVEAITDLNPPDPTSSFLWRQLYAGLTVLGVPWLVASSLFLGTWLLGTLWFQREIEARLARARLAYTHPDQGKLIDRVRQVLRAGPMRTSVSDFTEKIYRGMVRQLRSEIDRAITRIQHRLEERRREVAWLRQQMREFLRTHGVDPANATAEIAAVGLRAASYRVVIERERDLARVLSRNPVTADRFRSMQSEVRPFRQWNKRYCDDFLYPVLFLERLSEEYEDPPEFEAAARDSQETRQARARELLEFLTQFAQFPVAFVWGGAPGAVANTDSYCVIPPLWLNLPEVDSALSGHGFTRQRILESVDPDRVYLLQVQLGVSSERLL